MKFSDPNLLLGWAFQDSKLIDVRNVTNRPHVLVSVRDDPDVLLLVHPQKPLSAMVRQIILEAYFQETFTPETPVPPVYAPTNGGPPEEEPARA